MAQILLDIFYSFGNCMNCFPGSPTLKVNSRSFKILRLLGEGGFSYVYLVQDTATQEQFALKKIRCPFGAESVAQAMKEVEAYRLFAHTPGIIHSTDYAIATERGGEPGSKTVYVLLPYYKRGNLQDMINANLVSHYAFEERKILMLFLGVCKALKAMHQYRGPPAGMERMEMGNEEDEEEAASGRRNKKKGKRLANSATARADEDDEGEQQQPLMEGENAPAAGEVRSYAHRDIKPGNIMIADNGSDPILMDLGSIAASPLPITSHSLAIQTQDTAAEHSTMPYRAPELFDVRTGTVIDTKVDIWSMGCTLYACLVGKSPFEMRSDETGGSLSLCVLGGDWRFPDEGAPGVKRSNTASSAKGKALADQAADSSKSDDGAISEPVKELVRRCLMVEPAERPDIDELIEMVSRVLEGPLKNDS